MAESFSNQNTRAVGVVTTSSAGSIGVTTNLITGISTTNVTGVSTSATFHVGLGGTVINATDTGTVQIGSATTLATVTINGGSVPSVGLVIALGG